MNFVTFIEIAAILETFSVSQIPFFSRRPYLFQSHKYSLGSIIYMRRLHNSEISDEPIVISLSRAPKTIRHALRDLAFLS